MLPNGSTFEHGDRGERYQVEVAGHQYTTDHYVAREWHILGWTNKRDGGALVRHAKAHPGYGGYRVLDRGVFPYDYIMTAYKSGGR